VIAAPPPASRQYPVADPLPWPVGQNEKAAHHQVGENVALRPSHPASSNSARHLRQHQRV